MKVKVADLKANLSGYLRTLRKTGTPIEVCLREERIAYLTAAPPDPAGAPEAGALNLQFRLREAGLRWTPPPGPPAPRATPAPRMAGDGRTDISTIQQMRREKAW